jgi:hypothetical protein
VASLPDMPCDAEDHKSSQRVTELKLHS